MFGETNQNTNDQSLENTNVNDDVFTFDMADIEADDAQESDAELESASAPQPSTERIKVKYNGSEVEYDTNSQREEIATLIQKGMNYDHVLTERDSLKNSEEMAFLEEMAKKNGFENRKAFIEKVKADAIELEVNHRAEQLKAEGMSEQHALYTARLEQQTKRIEPPKAQVPAQAEPIEKLTQGFKELIDEYPEVRNLKSINDLPPEVLSMIEAGKQPLFAYQKFLLDQTKSEAEKLKQFQNNQQRDLGTLKTGKGENSEDSFLSGLFRK